MRGLRRKVVSGDSEKNIVTGMVVSTDYCRDVIPILKLEYFQADFVRRVVKWILEYYEQYQEAPGKHIQDIFAVEKESLKEAEAEMIEGFISGLSDRYEAEGLNIEYLMDNTIEYFKRRSLDILSQNISGHTARGKIELAEEAVRDYSKVAKAVSGWVNPFEQKEIQDAFDDEHQDRLFTFPGALGKMIGWLERDTLVSFLGPMKRGKSFLLEELAVQALATRLKVVLISLEMNKTKMQGRLYKRLTGLPDTKGKIIVYPVFDCVYNQNGTCKKRQRKKYNKWLRPLRSKYTEAMHVGGYPEAPRKLRYVPCTYCRDNGIEDYALAVWHSSERKKQLSKKATIKKVKEVKILFGDNLRIISYPAFSAGFDDIDRDLDNLEYTEGFIPDVIAIDYFDILAAETARLSERGNIDATWKRGKMMAGQRHCLVATVSQSTRKSIEKRSVGQVDTAEDIRKLAHVEAMYSLNQQLWEKNVGIMRVGIVVKRHGEFNENTKVVVLQSLDLGQPLLDSEFERRGLERKKKSLRTWK